jgi:effector-binding domain-containing protein
MLDMKKRVLIPGIVALLIGVYFFLPTKRPVVSLKGSRGSIVAASRYFTDTSKWRLWWPREGHAVLQSGPAFTYHGLSYTVSGIFYNEVRVSIAGATGSAVDADLHMVQVNSDSVLLGGECQLPIGINLFRRDGSRQRAKVIKDNLDSIFRAFNDFMDDGRNIYGVKIGHAMSDDSILVTLSNYTSVYPSTDEIYAMIDSVRAYVAMQGAVMHNYPLLNVASAGNKQFRAMVALSVNKRLEGNGRIIVKRFVPWKMIEGEVKGGAHTADKAMEQLFQFRDDNHLSIMSIPFQFLITDRRKEPDSTKWVTRVCAPIS